MELLEKTRHINRTLQRANSSATNFNDICEVLRDVIDCNLYVIGRKGKLMGRAVADAFAWSVASVEQGEGNASFTSVGQTLLDVSETLVNPPDRWGIVQTLGLSEQMGDKYLMIVPITGGGDRLGTLLLLRMGRPFNEEDLLLAEYGATVVGIEVLRSRAEEIEQEARSKAVVQLAINSLSYSELEAVQHILGELDGYEGLLVASKIADRVGITRSVIVNALRKLESAGVIESRSLGMKGTYIKVLNPKLLDELAAVSH